MKTSLKANWAGPAVAIASGVVHNLAADDVSLLADVRSYLGFLGVVGVGTAPMVRYR